MLERRKRKRCNKRQPPANVMKNKQVKKVMTLMLAGSMVAPGAAPVAVAAAETVATYRSTTTKMATQISMDSDALPEFAEAQVHDVDATEAKAVAQSSIENAGYSGTVVDAQAVTVKFTNNGAVVYPTKDMTISLTTNGSLNSDGDNVQYFVFYKSGSSKAKIINDATVRGKTSTTITTREVGTYGIATVSIAKDINHQTDTETKTDTTSAWETSQQVYGQDGEACDKSDIHNGDILTYQITVKNKLEDRGGSATVTAKLPNGTTLVKINDDGKAYSDGSLRWKIPSTPARGDSTTVSYTVRVDKAREAVADIDTFASTKIVLDGNEGSSASVSNTTHNFVPEVTKIVTDKDGNNLNGTMVQDGEKVYYHIYVTNSDSASGRVRSGTHRVTVKDAIPEGFTLTNATEKGVTVKSAPDAGDVSVDMNTAGRYVSTVNDASSITWNEEFEAGEVKEYVYEVTASGNSMVYSGAAKAIFGDSTPRDESDDEAKHVYQSNNTVVNTPAVPVAQLFDLTGKSVDRNYLTPGQGYILAVTVNNNSDYTQPYTISQALPDEAEAVYIDTNGIETENPAGVDDGTIDATDLVTSELKPLEEDARKATMPNSSSYTDHTVTWVNNVKAGQTKTFFFVFKTNEKGIKLSQNATMKVSATPVDPDTDSKIATADGISYSDVTDFVTSWTPQDPVLTVTRTLTNSTGQVKAVQNMDGGLMWAEDECVLTYKVAFENTSEKPQVFHISADVDPNTEFVSASDDGSYNRSTGTVTWSVTVKPGESKYVTYDAKATDEGKATDINVKATQKVGKAVNYSNVVDIDTTPMANIKVEDDDGNDMSDKIVNQDDELVYTISVKNPDERSHEFVLKEHIPDTAQFVLAKKGVSIASDWAKDEPVSKQSLIMIRPVGITPEVKQNILTAVENKYGLNYDSVDKTSGEVTLTGMVGSVKRLVKSIQEDVGNDYQVTGNIDPYGKASDNIDAADTNEVTVSEDKKDIQWVADIPAGEEYQFVFRVKTKDVGVPITTNAAVQVDKVERETNKVTNYVAEAPTIAQLVDGKEAETKVLFDGDNNKITYQISFSNPSDKEKTFTITDNINSKCAIISADNDGSISGQKVTWKVTVPANSSKTVSVTVQPNNTVGRGSISNYATVSVDSFTAKTKSTTVYTTDAPSKDIVSADGKTSLNGSFIFADTTYAYQITFDNPTDETRTFHITDTLPEGLQFVSADNGGKYDLATRTVQWKNLTVPAGQSCVLTYKVKANTANTDADVSSTAHVEDQNDNSVYSKDTNGPHLYVGKAVVAAVDANGTDMTEKIVPNGTKITYTVHLNNPSATDQKATIRVLLPSGINFNSSTDGASASGQAVTFANVTVPVGGKDYTFTATTAYTTSSTTNKTSQEGKSLVVATDVIVNGSSFSANSIRHYAAVVPQLTAEVDNQNAAGKTFGADNVVDYTITVTNPADSSKEFTVTDAIPDGAVIADAGEGTVKGNTVTYTATLASGEAKEFHVSVKSKNPEKSLTIKNSAKVTVDGNTASTATVSTILTPGVRAALTEMLGGNELEEGQIVANDSGLVYKIHISNPDMVAKTVQVIDRLPEGVTYTSNELSTGKTQDVQVSGQSVKFGDVSIPADGLDITIYAKATDLEGKSGANTVNINMDADTKILTLKGATIYGMATPTMTAQAGDVDVTDNGSYEADDEITYTISVTNPAKNTKSFTITDKIPDGTEVVSAPGAKIDDSKVVFTASIGAGATKKFEVTLRSKNPTAAKQLVVKNLATVAVDGSSLDTKAITLKLTPGVTTQMTESLNNKTLASNAVVFAGDTLQYKIHIANPENVAKTIQMVDTLPTGLTYVSYSLEGGKVQSVTTSGQKITFKNVSVPVDGMDVIINAKASDFEGQSGANKVELTANGKTYSSTGASIYGVVSPTLEAAVAGAKVESGTSYAMDTEVAYNITVTNPSAESKTFTVTAPIPEGTKIVSAPDAKIEDTNAVFTASIPGGTSKTFTMTVKAKNTDTEKQLVLSSKAKVAVDGHSIDTNNVTLTLTPGVTLKLDETLGGKSLAPSTIVNNNDTLKYTIHITNPENASKTVQLVDTLPNGMQYVSYKLSGGKVESVSSSGQAVTFKNVSVPVDGMDIEITARAVDFADKAGANKVDLTVDNKVLSVTGKNVYGANVPVLTATIGGKTVDSETAYGMNDEIVYTITVKNASEVAKTYTVTDPIPDGTEVVSAPDALLKNNNAVYTATVAPQSSKQFTLKLKAKDQTSGKSLTIKNAATVAVDDTTTSTNEMTILLSPGVKMTMSEALGGTTLTEGTLVSNGDTLTYTIHLTNPEKANKTVKLVDTLPQGVKYVSYSLSGGSVENVAASGQKVTFTNLSVPVDGMDVEITAKVADFKGRTGANKAAVTVDDKTITANGTTIYGLKDPTITATVDGKKATTGTYGVNDEVTYTITVQNPAPTAQDITITSPIPSGMTITDTSGAIEQNGNLVWTKNVDSGDTWTVTYKAKPTSTTSETVATTSASMVLNGTTLTTKNISLTFTADMTASMEVTDGAGTKVYASSLPDGSTIQFKIHVDNPKSTAVKATIKDTLPAGLSYVSSTGGATNSGQTVTWNNIQIPAGGADYTIDATLKNAGGKTMTNSATITADKKTISTNSVVVYGMEAPTIAVTANGKDADKQTVGTDQKLSYTVTVKNPSNIAKLVTVSTNIPDGMQSAGATVKDGNIYMQRTLSAGETAKFNFELTAKDPKKKTTAQIAADVNFDGKTMTTDSVTTILDPKKNEDAKDSSTESDTESTEETAEETGTATRTTGSASDNSDNGSDDGGSTTTTRTVTTTNDGGSDGSGTTKTTSTTKTVKTAGHNTGDASHMGAWIVGIVAAVAAAFAGIFVSKKRKKAADAGMDAKAEEKPKDDESDKKE